MEDRVKLALEALDSAKQNVEHPTDCERSIDQAIAALTAPEERRDVRDEQDFESWFKDWCNKTEDGDPHHFVSQRDKAIMFESWKGRDLSASRQVVPREAIRDVLSEGQVPIDVYITADAFEILIDAIYALQLSAPQPVAGIDKLRMYDHGDAFYYKCQDVLDLATASAHLKEPRDD